MRARAKGGKLCTQDHDETVAWGFASLRMHDLKHTLCRHLRAVGAPLETRKGLLGHRNGDINSKYSAPEIEGLLEAANRVGRPSPHGSVLRLRSSPPFLA